MRDWAVIFDVDGVLLELTRAEEELFFKPFATRLDADALSRDWNSYRIRNDAEIIKEICEAHGLAASERHMIMAEYLALLEAELAGRSLESQAIPGAVKLLLEVAPFAMLGIATANFRKAAELRLRQLDLWAAVAALAFGADEGGHKSEILARAIAASALPPSRIIYVGDNITDVVAGLTNHVHFIGFSIHSDRLRELAQHGATQLAQNHNETLALIKSFLVC